MEQLRVAAPLEALELGVENKDFLAAGRAALETEDELVFATASDEFARKKTKKKAKEASSSSSEEEDGASSGPIYAVLSTTFSQQISLSLNPSVIRRIKNLIIDCSFMLSLPAHLAAQIPDEHLLPTRVVAIKSESDVVAAVRAWGRMGQGL